MGVTNHLLTGMILQGILGCPGQEVRINGDWNGLVVTYLSMGNELGLLGCPGSRKLGSIVSK